MSQPHSYSSLYPEHVRVKEGIKEFFEEFYRISDTESEHEDYVGSFGDGAEFVLGGKRSVGRQEISTTRTSMWTHISSRLHTPTKIFPFGNDTNEFMLYGTVNYTFRAGGEGKVEWAGHARLVEEEERGRWRFERYRVYLDPKN